ncbi:MAG: hypothetical protein AB1640_05640 [bacterium]
MPDKPHAAEWVALGALLFAAVAFSLIRLDMTDTPWHLATARLAFATGQWPTHNTFSYTYPDYPLNQQYPLYQSLLYVVHSIAKWEGLSILHGLLWVAVFCLWVLWGGSLRAGSKLSALWLLGLLGLQRRMILRPDLMTMLLFVLLLHLVDRYRNGRTWAAGLFVLVQFLMVNSHQLFPLGLGVQGAFLAHLILVRARPGKCGLSSEDLKAPIWPVVLALAGSVLACFGTPLGAGILDVPAHTMGSLAHHREEVQEFAPFYDTGYGTALVMLAAGAAVAGFWRKRRQWEPYEAFLWLMGAALVAAASRGLPFFVMLSVGICARSFPGRGEAPPLAGAGSRGRWVANVARIACVVLTIEASLFVMYKRWVSPPRTLGGTQPGIGLALGDWPGAAIDFIRSHPPPGRMMNIPWYAANPLIWELYPAHQVFVDPRFETYPREFLVKAIRSETDQGVLEELIAEYQPGWIVAWISDRRIRQRVAGLMQGGGWALVHADTVFVILVRDTPEHEDYLAENKISPEDIAPRDFLESEPDLLALQQIRMAGFYQDLGLQQRAEDMIGKAAYTASRYSAPGEALEDYRKVYFRKVDARE